MLKEEQGFVKFLQVSSSNLKGWWRRRPMLVWLESDCISLNRFLRRNHYKFLCLISLLVLYILYLIICSVSIDKLKLLDILCFDVYLFVWMIEWLKVWYLSMHVFIDTLSMHNWMSYLALVFRIFVISWVQTFFIKLSWIVELKPYHNFSKSKVFQK